MTTEFILYVRDQNFSRDFYAAVLEKMPVLDVPGMTEFFLSTQCKLGLMPENRIANIICPALPHPSTASGKPRCELYLYVSSCDEKLNHALQSGATLVSECSNRDWGHRVGYCADPDGHVLAFASPLT